MPHPGWTRFHPSSWTWNSMHDLREKRDTQRFGTTIDARVCVGITSLVVACTSQRLPPPAQGEPDYSPTDSVETAFEDDRPPPDTLLRDWRGPPAAVLEELGVFGGGFHVDALLSEHGVETDALLGDATLETASGPWAAVDWRYALEWLSLNRRTVWSSNLLVSARILGADDLEQDPEILRRDPPVEGYDIEIRDTLVQTLDLDSTNSATGLPIRVEFGLDGVRVVWFVYSECDIEVEWLAADFVLVPTWVTDTVAFVIVHERESGELCSLAVEMDEARLSFASSGRCFGRQERNEGWYSGALGPGPFLYPDFGFGCGMDLQSHLDSQ